MATKDPKYWLMLAVAVASLLVPIWLWRADLASKSLDATIISVASLKPTLQGVSSSTIDVVIDGQAIIDPFVTVLELRNSGSRPILQSDFESPLQISLPDDVTLARAYVTLTEPRSIRPQVTPAKKSLSIAPLLLNPSDTVRLTIVTSGGKPEFSAQARIAGIDDVVARNTTSDIPIAHSPWLFLVASLGLLAASSGASMRAWRAEGLPVLYFIDLFATFASYLLASALTIAFAYFTKIDYGIWVVILLLALQAAVVIGFRRIAGKQSGRRET
jgi:hypothetical protein